MTTLGLVSASLAGLVYAKRNGLFYQGFAITLGAIFAFDLLQRRNIDVTTILSTNSS